MNIKDSFTKMSNRDKLLLVVLAFGLAFTGVYFLHQNLTEERETLKMENESLSQQKNMMSSVIKAIKPTEEKLEGRVEETEEYYSLFYEDFDSPIAFERLFLGWLNGRNIRVNSFSYSEPTPESLVYVYTEETLTPMGEYASELNKYDENYIEEVKERKEGVVIEKEEPKVEDLDLNDDEIEYADDDWSEDVEPEEPVSQVLEGDIVVLASTFTYDLTLSKFEYTRLVDKINYHSKLIYLVSSSYTDSSEEESAESNVAPDTRGSGTFTIKVYSVEKPQQFELAEDYSYFKYSTIKPILIYPKEEPVENSGTSEESTEDSNTDN